MNALKAPFLILGYLASLLGLSALSDAPSASDGLVEAPPATVYQAHEYLEAPVEALAATTTTEWVEPQPKSDCEIALQLALDVGWPANEMARLATVLWRESRCTAQANNLSDPMGGSRGYLQVNQFWCKPNSNWPQGWLQAHDILTHCDELFHPAINLRAGLAIWRNSGWHPWGIK